MMTARKRVGPLPIQQLAVRHSIDHSLSDSSSRHSLSDHSSPDLLSTSARPSRKRYALRDRGINARAVVEAVDQDEIETGVRGLVEVRVERITHLAMPEDIPEPA
uniref:Uncharacterized protein n=1 Tax=Tanacetum cinerariifolium TaxID=118510 RepID=A0A699RIN8_TANCI|nr:hypothetical protein [Tanacetum cinerariifolium]